jgi:hypothetical protein
MNNYAEIREANKRRFLALNPKLNDESGIYILYREESGIKHAYVGQAKHILTRLAQHLSGFQHIDLSLKKHGLATEEANGWKVHFEPCPISVLDHSEREWIKRMANKGYQLKNKTLGGQNEGKDGLDNQKPSRGYHDGLAQGYKNAQKEVAHLFSLHLNFNTKSNPPTKHQQNAVAKFNKFLEVE